MALLDFLFGSSKKNTTTTSTQATQNTSNVSADGGGFLAQASDVTIDNSQQLDYRLTDSRDLSTSITDNSDNSQNYSVADYSDRSLSAFDASQRDSNNSSVLNYSDSRATNSVDARTWTDRSVVNDSRSTSTISYDLTPDVIKTALASLDKAVAGSLSNVNSADARRSSDAQAAIGGAYNASLEFFNTSAGALREAYDANAENLAGNTERVLDAVVEANRTDGQALVDTVNKFGKYAALIVGGVIFVSFLRRA